ncbi:RNA polymerase sigma factor [Paucisalibacillus sp. EB02]|uniref:RNA polymerase sigma factor n=1 Tax=Paucisalibacillus sp. EB02 TaxID=1347087 RepID=UPI0005AA2D30|nr:RNA polymerase sigma factor [Paucisalibacillus sp. EB02]
MQELEDIYKELHPKILTFFLMKTANQVVAEDLTQEVFYQAMKSIHSFQGYATIQTWLFAIAKNILKKYYRSKWYKRNLEIKLTKEVETEQKTLEDLYVVSEEAREIMTQIQVLDDLPKEIIILRIYGDLSFKEIAQLVEKTENYVRVTFHRAKVKIKTEMGAKKA